MPIRTEKATVVAEDGRRLLSEVSCTFGSGELTLLVGANGAGKSTLLDVLSGLTACEGTVELDGVPIRDGRRLNQEAAYRIGRQFQYPESQLFAATVQKEFDYSLGYMKLPDDENRTRTDRAMSEMGLADSLKAESPLVLSGGEKRRVAIATTLAADPDWLLLDEPTAGLDPEAASRLVSALLSRKGRPSGGIIAATHDLDLLLPAADRVVVLREGGVIADMPASELALRPDVWDRAGIGRPASAELAGQLRLLGLPVPAKFLAPEEAADLIAGRLRAAGGRPSLETDAYGEPPGEGAAAQPGAALARDRVPEQDRERGSGRIAGSPKRFVESLDPRAKWLFMMTFSIGVLIQRDWLGFGLGAIAAAALLLLCRVPARHIVPLMRPFLWFAAASVAVSGLGIGEAGLAASSSGGAWESGAGGGATEAPIRFGVFTFSAAAAGVTSFELLKIGCVMVAGILLSATTTPFEMKRAIEYVLLPLRYIRFPVEAVALTGSLLLRFIPVLRREAVKFNRIARSRGKRVRRSGATRLRDLPVMIVPLLMSLLQMATDLTVSMEARGYTRTGQRRTSAVQLVMSRRDWAVVATALAVAVIFAATSIG
ncbi:ATP-binding cassette domain-containing protein [Paenibacillus sp. GCM10012303]|uniref:ATP-binding cassette domain-containing protein n=1 Tax=Paenibacillus sp. GCM10012303 TaxID=3317340 RepID=UPI00360C0559